MLYQFQKARGRGASLIAITTPDQQSVERSIASSSEDVPVIAMDSVRGLRALNKLGKTSLEVISERAGDMNPEEITDWPSVALLVTALRTKVTLIVHNAHRLVEGQDALRSIQGIMNLRDMFSSIGSTLVLLCTSWVAPPELGSDVLVIDDPLPRDNDRAKQILDLLDSAIGSGCEIDSLRYATEQCVRSTRGLSRYATEQTVSLSLEKDGLDVDQLDSRFVEAINSRQGLTLDTQIVPADDIGGLQNIKNFADKLNDSQIRPDLVVFIDEIDKALAGSATGGDNTGTSQEFLGEILKFMQDEDAQGLISLGPPGTGKSMIARCIGGVLDVPTVALDLGAMKTSKLGESGANIRMALKTLKQLARRTFWVATCNRLESGTVPPELRRRFKRGIWFFDLPNADERNDIWSIKLNQFGLKAQDRPDDSGWTGSDIEGCVEMAWAMNSTLCEVESFLPPPVSKAMASDLEALRRQADGRFISASDPGVYRYQTIEDMNQPKRKMEF